MRAGHEPVIFHANGVGGPAMETLVEAGALGGVIDYTLSELANSLMDGIHTTGPDRLRVAGRHGLPQVVVPGCVDFFNQGPRDTLPEQLPRPQELLPQPRRHARAARRAEEETALGRIVAERLNEARGPVRVVAPTRGLLARRRRGRRPLGPGGRPARSWTRCAAALRSDIPYESVDAHVDDHAFADVVAERYLTLVPEPAHAR